MQFTVAAFVVNITLNEFPLETWVRGPLLSKGVNPRGCSSHSCCSVHRSRTFRMWLLFYLLSYVLFEMTLLAWSVCFPITDHLFSLENGYIYLKIMHWYTRDCLKIWKQVLSGVWSHGLKWGNKQPKLKRSVSHWNIMQIYDNTFNKLYWQKIFHGSSLSLFSVSWYELMYCRLELIPLAARGKSELGPRTQNKVLVPKLFTLAWEFPPVDKFYWLSKHL